MKRRQESDIADLDSPFDDEDRARAQMYECVDKNGRDVSLNASDLDLPRGRQCWPRSEEAVDDPEDLGGQTCPV